MQLYGTAHGTLGGPHPAFWSASRRVALKRQRLACVYIYTFYIYIYLPYVYPAYIYWAKTYAKSSFGPISDQSRFFGLYFIFVRFCILGWIRSGHGIQNHLWIVQFISFLLLFVRPRAWRASRTAWLTTAATPSWHWKAGRIANNVPKITNNKTNN